MNTPKTNSTNHAALMNKIDSLFSKDKITNADIANFTDHERKRLGDVINRRLVKLKGDERDRLLNKIEHILPPDAKSAVWEHNHQLISNMIENYLGRFRIMPNKTAIAEQTGLSRQTVTKHMANFNMQPEFTGEFDQFRYMTHKMLANVFTAGNRGDIKAARLYFEIVGALHKQPSAGAINGQTNYIQINNTILSQENLKQLSAEQLNQIENIITNQKLLAQV